MSTESCTCCRRIRLDGLTLVEKSLVVDFLEKIPESLDITVVICDVRIIHIDPITHTFGHIHPLCSIFHDLLAACVIVLFHRNLRADIFLGYTQHLFHTKLDRKTMGIPSCTTVHLKSALSLVSAYCILDGTGHDMVDTRHTVG